MGVKVKYTRPALPELMVAPWQSVGRAFPQSCHEPTGMDNSCFKPWSRVDYADFAKLCDMYFQGHAQGH